MDFLAKLGSPTLLWIIWGLHVGVFIAAAFILGYHWKSYAGMRDAAIRKARKWFYIASIALLLLSALLILLV